MGCILVNGVHTRKFAEERRFSWFSTVAKEKLAYFDGRAVVCSAGAHRTDSIVPMAGLWGIECMSRVLKHTSTCVIQTDTPAVLFAKDQHRVNAALLHHCTMSLVTGLLTLSISVELFVWGEVNA